MIRNVGKIIPALLLAFIALAWVSCTQERQQCLTPKNASLILETMHKTTDTGTVFVDTALPSAVFWAQTNLASSQNQILLFSKGAGFGISLSPDDSFCQWVFSPDSARFHQGLITGHQDTLTFNYKRNLQFLSNACGYTYFYTLTSVRTTRYSDLTPYYSIDSAHIINNSVSNNVNTKHVQVFIHPGF